MDRAVFERDRLALVSPRHCADRARIGVRCTSLAREHAPNDATERQEAATTHASRTALRSLKCL